MKKKPESITYWYFNGVEEHQFKLGQQPDGYVRGRKPREWTEDQLNEMIKNQKKHFREKFGTDWATQTPEVQEKRKKTTLELYGVKCNLEIPEIKEAAHSSEAREKRINSYKQTMNEKYDVDNYYQTEEFKEHSKEVKQQRYDDPYYSNREKANATILDKYDSFDNYYAIIKSKGEQTCFEKYGVKSYAQTEEWSSRRRVKYQYDDYSFDSLWELSFYIWAKDHHKSIDRCNISFTYTFNGVEHIYHPDFIYENELIEIKGDHFFEVKGDKTSRMICPFNRDLDDLFEAKHQCMIANNVKILTGKDLKEVLDYFSLHYNIEELKYN